MKVAGGGPCGEGERPRPRRGRPRTLTPFSPPPRRVRGEAPEAGAEGGRQRSDGAVHGELGARLEPLRRQGRAREAQEEEEEEEGREAAARGGEGKEKEERKGSHSTVSVSEAGREGQRWAASELSALPDPR